jgi:GNAT superfamily N-acetyltransferase
MTGSTVIGFVALSEARVEQLFVLPGEQGHGVGKRLLDFAKTLHPKGLWLTMTAANQRAARFYEREGLERGQTSVHPRLGHHIVRYDWLP